MTLLTSPQNAALWLRERVCGRLQIDSRQVQPGDGFIAWPGAMTDGRQFVDVAMAQGASACLVEHEGWDAFHVSNASKVGSYRNLKANTGWIADAYYEHPSRDLTLVAITGTNGKTSSAWWLAWALTRLRHTQLSPGSLIGTLGIGRPDALEYTGMTTPDPITLHGHLRWLVSQGVKSCAVEASSIGLAEHRLDGAAIKVAGFTNFSQDHLDYHGSMDQYWAAKAILFDWPALESAVINIDDARGDELVRHACSRGLDVWTISQHSEARLSATHVDYGEYGLNWVLREGAQSVPMATNLVGEYNVSNMLGVIGVLRALGIPLLDAVKVCMDLPSVPGRMESIDLPDAPLAIVDFAHTPDALDKALNALRPLAEQRGGRLWCVFGCGGNRDVGKRPLMGAVAERYADVVLVTSDNPRSEDPSAIANEIVAGMKRPPYAVTLDRADAIEHALGAAEPCDVVLIAGKGHETYQEMGDKRLPFSDQERARHALRTRMHRNEVRP
jgi:UDP-N-acetylmuramoyl-L-alanyl-D-glutamate--2,6-diaminopimelate ligase